MSGFWLIIALLLVASCVLVVLAGSRGNSASANDRDTLNQRFYHQRLRELEDDEAQGVVDDRPEMVRELQLALLMDIPERSPVIQRQVSRRLLLPGVVVLLLVSCGVYLKAGGLQQLLAWQQVQNELPALRAQAMHPNARPLTMEQLARLALGLRTELQQYPENVNDWMLLGRLDMALNNATSASQAFRRALQLSPNNAGAKIGYVEVLARSGDPQDNREANAMLNEMVSHDERNLQLLGLLAFNDFSLQNYAHAMGIWQKMLQLLPADDKRVTPIRRSIAQAKSASGLQESQLALTVKLSDAAEKMLPLRGVLYISVTDGISPVPVAVKKVPLSHFPLSLTLDDSHAMMPDRVLSAQRQLQVRIRISRDGSANPQPGDWYGLSAVTPFTGHQQLAVDINRQ
ncbi:c-type cytochrome biogenesis protein CcmI [Erwinia amylovora]|uniref:c-type cytochrome biogenesis protein CcmI n=1 Tax=Erwinia amylovora TaxID=552 RepID=UPI001443A15D|nr:c-type cytochrome biogenesis protein CcmI [Erwinia amylovora]